MLNALDGIGAQEGRILFATTNKYSALDPALCRPGRMDLHLEFRLASKYQARELFARFYLPSEASIEDVDEESEKESVDSGYASTQSTNHDNSDNDTSSEKYNQSEPSASLTGTDTVIKNTSVYEGPAFVGTTHAGFGEAPRFSRTEIANLAARFAEAIPERECSMASLQNYLMGFKTRPHTAVKDAKEWVEKERAALVAKSQGVKDPAAVAKTIASGSGCEKTAETQAKEADAAVKAGEAADCKYT